MATLRLQKPLTLNGNNIYPLTTYNQIIMPDSSRWDGKLGSGIQVEPVITSGTKLATITVDGVSKDLYYQGSSVNLNGISTQNASFYAPTKAGNAGQVLVSSGNGEPSWGNMDWIPESGGTITGDILRRVTEADVLQSNNGVTASLYPTIFYMVDKNYNTISKIESSIEPSGSLNSRWHVRNYNTDGSLSAQIGILLTATKNGWTQCRVEGDTLIQGGLTVNKEVAIADSSYPQLMLRNASGQDLSMLFVNTAQGEYGNTILRVNSGAGENEFKEFCFHKSGYYSVPGEVYCNNGSSLVLHRDNYSNYALPLSGGTLTGPLSLGNQNWILQDFYTGQSPITSRQYGKAHAIQLGIPGRDYINFYEYGGVFNFYKTSSVYDDPDSTSDGVLVAQITSDGFIGNLSGNATTATRLGSSSADFSTGIDGNTVLLRARINGIMDWAIARNQSNNEMASHFYDKTTGNWVVGRVLLDSGNYSGYALPLSGGTLSGPAYTTSAFTVSGGKVAQFASAPLGGLFSNGVAFTSPATPNDAGWIRMLGTGEHDTVLEIATGDDGGAEESIVVRQYNTSNTVAREAYLLNTAGNTTFPGFVSADGLLISRLSGRSLTFGCQNTSFAHYNTDADSGHWFNKNVYVQGDIYCGSSYNTLVLTTAGGRMTGTLTHGSVSTSWIDMTHGHGAIINLNEAAINGGATACWAVKTHTGSWGCGNLSGNDNLYFCWGSDSNFTAGNNTANSTVHITSTGGIYGAVWNDYAEFRSQNETIEPGYIAYCDDDGKLKKTTERLQKFEGIVSDTFGFAIGETDDCQTPLAVSGRALVYCDPEEEHFHSGDCVCAGPDGLAYRMTREEIIEFPDRIVGVVSEIPTYETWGSGNVAVNGRIWVKVK